VLSCVQCQSTELATIGRAFDEAWQEIKSRYDDDPVTIEDARLRLADAVMAAYHAGLANPDLIKARALGSSTHALTINAPIGGTGAPGGFRVLTSPIHGRAGKVHRTDIPWTTLCALRHDHDQDAGQHGP
jgi:hypothetical protein